MWRTNSVSRSDIRCIEDAILKRFSLVRARVATTSDQPCGLYNLQMTGGPLGSEKYTFYSVDLHLGPDNTDGWEHEVGQADL